MNARLQQLRDWGLASSLLRLADGDPPHPAFEPLCERLRYDERCAFVPDLDRAEARPETGGHVSAAMWERDHGDGHAFDIVYCAAGGGGIEFWHVVYADDTDGPQSRLVATTEQGLLYWLVFTLIGSEFSRHGEGAYSTLAAAARSVHFAHLVEVFKLEEEIGSDFDRHGELIERSLSIG